MPVFALQAGKFNIVPTIIAIGSGVALLGAVSNLPIMFLSVDNLVILKGLNTSLPVTKKLVKINLRFSCLLLGSVCM